MFEEFWKIGKKRRSVLAISIGLFLIISFLVIFFSTFDRANSRKMAYKYLIAVTEGVTKTVDLWIDEKKNMLLFISELPEVKDALQNKAQLSQIRTQLYTNYPLDLETVFFASPEGILLDDLKADPMLKNLKQLEIWEKFRNNGHQPYLDTYVYRTKETGKLTFIILKGVYTATDKLLGFVGFTTDWDNFIEKFIAPVKVGETGYLAITDTTGRNIGHHDSALTLKTMAGYDWMQNVLQKKNGEQSYVFKGEAKLMAFRQSHQSGWIINASTNERELTGSTIKLRNAILLISLALLLIGFFIIVYLDKIKLDAAERDLEERERNLRLLFKYDKDGDFSVCSVFSSCLINAFDRGNDSVFIHSVLPDKSVGKFIKVNEAFLSFFNCPLEDVLEVNPTEVLGKSMKEDYTSLFEEVIESESKVLATEMETQKAGSFIELRLFCINANEELAILGFVRDITDRAVARRKLKKDRDNLDTEVKKQTDEILAVNEKLKNHIKEKDEIAKALSESEARYRSLIERANDGIMLVMNGQIIFANQKICSLLKFRGESLEGMAFDKIVSSQERERVIKEHKNRLNGIYTSRIFETILLASDGEQIAVEINAGVIHEQQESQDFMFVRDIRLRKQQEEEERYHHEQMIQTDKLAALGTLLLGVAHEINNPNNAIMLNSPIIKEAWESIVPILDDFKKETGDFIISGMPYSYFKDYIEDIVEDIYKSSERIKNIVKELKDFAKPDAGTLQEDIQVNKVIRSSMRLLARQLSSATSHFSVSLGKSLPLVQGSFFRLEQVIVNLLQNACHSLASPQDSIKIKTSYDKEKQQVQIDITDQGCGISSENLKQIFDPFFTTKRDKGGTGLGLSVSLKIIKEHQGTLTFSSEEGKGTKARIRLPIKSKTL